MRSGPTPALTSCCCATFHPPRRPLPRGRLVHDAHAVASRGGGFTGTPLNTSRRSNAPVGEATIGAGPGDAFSVLGHQSGTYRLESCLEIHRPSALINSQASAVTTRP